MVRTMSLMTSTSPVKHTSAVSKPTQPVTAPGLVMTGLWCITALVLTVFDGLPATVFNQAFCGLVGVGLALQFSGLTQFYAWFKSSGLWLAGRRGMGSRGHPVYGLWHPPALSLPSFTVLGDCLLGALLLVGTGLVTNGTSIQVMMAFAFVACILWFSQLFAETVAGQHSALVLPHVLCYLALAGDDVALLVWLVRWHMVSLYFGGGLSKLGGSIVGGNVWISGHTLRASTYHALWSRPGATSSSLISQAQAWVSSAPQWCLAVAATGAFLFELLAPVLAFVAPSVLGATAASFHVGVFFLLGIDFVTYWSPALLAFFVTPAVVSPTLAALSSPSLSSLTSIPLLHTVALLYFCAQWYFVLSLNEARGGPGPMPFSCSPMFAMPQHLTRDDMVNHFTSIVDGDGRSPGFLGTTEWSGPVFESHTLSETDLAALPWRVTYMTSTSCRFDAVSRCIKPEHRNTAHSFFTNVSPRPGEDADAVNAYVAALRNFSSTSVLCGPRTTPLTPDEQMTAIRDAVATRLHILDLRNQAFCS